MNSYFIKKVLANKHVKDFFMCEIKTGATWVGTGGLGIIDAFAMKKSWSKPGITAYEIKVKRGDFLQDNKWTKYLPYCNQFYFICPKDIIKRDEVGPDVGLYYMSTSGKIKTVKKAPYRNVKINNSIFRYILMNKIDSDRYPFHGDQKEYWKSWLENKKENKHLSWQVNSKLLKKVSQLEEQVQREQKEIKEYNEIKKIFRDNSLSTYSMERVIEEMITDKTDIRQGVKGDIIYNLERNIENLQATLEIIRRKDAR